MSGFSNTLVFLTSVLLVGDANVEPTPRPFIPNPLVMTHFDELITNVQSIKKDTLRQHLDVLIELAKGDKAEALVQILYQVALGFSTSKYDNDTLMSSTAITYRIWIMVQKEERLGALVRLLVNREDVVCEIAAWDGLIVYEQEYCAGQGIGQATIDGVCFEAFDAQIRGHLNSAGPVATALVDYLLQRSPTAVLKFLLPLSDTPPERQKTWLDVNQIVETHYKESRKSSGGRTRKEFCTSTTVTDEEITRLASLYDGASWWQKIYLAEVIRQNPFLSSEKLVNNLKESKEPLVLLSLEAAKLEETQGRIPGYSRWEIQAKGKKDKALAVLK